MTQEEKAKAYDEALKWMRELYPGLHGATKEDAEHYFPELRESEDERMRKLIIDRVRSAEEMTEGLRELLLTYLEKQKEQKPADLSEMMVHKEPYIAPVPTPMVADEQKQVKPTGKLSREDYLHQLLIEQLITYSDYEYLTGKKPAEWSEEDESMRWNIISVIGQSNCVQADDMIDWLKSLRPCPSWKPSEEQMEALRNAVHKFAKTDVSDSVRLSIMYDNLKKL